MRDAAIDPLRQSGRAPGRARSAPALDGMVGEGSSPRGAKPASRKGAVNSAAIAAQRLGGGRGAGALGAGRRPAAPGLAARLGSGLSRIRPLKLLTTSAFSIALVAIVANAMVFQRGRHPAPLFGFGQSVEGAGDAAPRVASAPPAVPPASAPAERTGSVPAAPAALPVETPKAPAAPAAAPKPVPVRHAAKPHREDGIGDLLGAKAPAAAAHPRPGRVAKAGVPEDKPGAHAEAKPHVAAAAPSPDHRAASEAAAILAHPDGTHHVKGEAPAKAHPRPQAAKVPAGTKSEAQKAAKAE